MKTRKRLFIILTLSIFGSIYSYSQVTVIIDTSTVGMQVIDGFGTLIPVSNAAEPWFQNLYLNDLMCSVVRCDISPQFKAPYSNNEYNSPWYGNNPPLPGPDGNDVRTYTDAVSYNRVWNGIATPIAVMDTGIATNIEYFNYKTGLPPAVGSLAKARNALKAQLGDFKIYGTMFSPEPWVKVLDGNTYSGGSSPGPLGTVPYPFIWNGCFSGGKLDVSDTLRLIFNDGVSNTTSLTQFSRSVAAYLKGLQDTFNISFYAISLQNELDFDEFYNSCFYPRAYQYIAALESTRNLFNKYPGLVGVNIIGPEDVFGGDAYGMWQYGSGNTASYKNLQFLDSIQAEASADLSFFNVHSYNSSLQNWEWWANGWTASPAAGIPANVPGFTYYNKKSWQTEESGQDTAWLYPDTGAPSGGAFGLALEMNRALTIGQESAYLYEQFTDPDGKTDDVQALTDTVSRANAPKYNAFKHFSRYIRPNALRLPTKQVYTGSDSLNLSAFIHKDNKTLTVVLINNNPVPETVTLNVPVLPFTIDSFQAYTSSNNSYWKNSTLTPDSNKTTLTIPAYGVSTLYGAGASPASVLNLSIRESVKIYPSPNNGKFILQIENGEPGINNEKMQADIYNIIGEEVYTTKLNTPNTAIDLSSEASGIYLYKVITATGELISYGKFIIQK